MAYLPPVATLGPGQKEKQSGSFLACVRLELDFEYKKQNCTFAHFASTYEELSKLCQRVVGRFALELIVEGGVV